MLSGLNMYRDESLDSENIPMVTSSMEKSTILTISKDSNVVSLRQRSLKRRAKFIRKVVCNVCNDIANDHIHYGAVACYSCRAFFRRAVNCKARYICPRNRQCIISKETRKNCQFCRFQRCLDAGMKRSWVMSESDKHQKRERALLKRIQTKLRSQTRKRRKKIIEEKRPNSTLFVVSKFFSTTTKTSSALLLPSLPTTDFSSYSPSSSFHSSHLLVPSSRELASDLIIEESLVEKVFHLPFSTEDQNLLLGMIHWEKRIRQEVPINPNTMKAFMDAATTSTPITFEAAYDGYHTCVQRINRFMNKLNIFNQFTDKDQRILLLYNTDMIVNIKAARFLRPGSNFQTQVTLVKGQDQDTKKDDISKSHQIEYRHVFHSPWCSSYDDELRYKSLMSKIFNLQMDEITIHLLIGMSIFSTTNCIGLNEAKKVNLCQEFFCQLLHKYLSTYDKLNIIHVFPKYIQILAQLEEMTKIILNKRLLF